MKRLFFTAAAAALLCSCGKDSFQSPDPEYPASDHTSAVVLSFGEAKTQDATKTFFDPTATAEAWEKSLTSVSALVFSTDGKLLVQRDFTPSEVSLVRHTQFTGRKYLRILCGSQQTGYGDRHQNAAFESAGKLACGL